MENITLEEMQNMTAALKNPEFRTLLADYCNEMADPKNQALYEKELAEYEAERGIDLTFITPEPGFVIKTIDMENQQKVFINVCRNAHVGKPTSCYACDQGGRRGLQWSIPLTQSPPTPDYDKKNQKCIVYDVVFHPDTLHLSARSREFRQLVVNTACDAVEKAFQVTLDRVNVRFPKMSFKGTPRPTVIRKKLSHHKTLKPPSLTPSIVDQFGPKVDMNDLNGERIPVTLETSKEADAQFTTPKHKLVQRREMEMHEMTHERDAKLNTTMPHELVVTVELPLLKGSQNVKLDVRERHLSLLCTEPAKYKLELPLPYAVSEDGGSAKFDSGNRNLIITLPVVQKGQLHLGDLSRALVKQASDSGLDSPTSPTHSSDEEVCNVGADLDIKLSSFLDNNIVYHMPSFTANALDNFVVFTLNVKNVDRSSVEVLAAEDSNKRLVVKFFSLGSGYVPNYYAFSVNFDNGSTIASHSAEAWDNNVVLQLEMTAVPKTYWYGDGQSEGVMGHLGVCKNGQGKRPIDYDPARVVSVHVDSGAPEELTIELVEEARKVETESETIKTGDKDKLEKRQNKQKRKGRSLSESDVKEHREAIEKQVEEQNKKPQKSSSVSKPGTVTTCINGSDAGGIRKVRSVSESGGDIWDANGNLFHFKGILKRRCVSDSFSSVDEHVGSVSVSFDMGVGSFEGIPEEDLEDSDHPEGSQKKHVTFNDVIRKQLFR